MLTSAYLKPIKIKNKKRNGVNREKNKRKNTKQDPTFRCDLSEPIGTTPKGQAAISYSLAGKIEKLSVNQDQTQR